MIPETAHMLGTLRAVSPSGRRRALEGVEQIAGGLAAAHEMHAVVTVEPGYPLTINDNDFADFTLDVAGDLLGSTKAGRMPTPVMGAEDFSYVLQHRPGALAFLGVCPPGTRPADAHACHSNRMTIDEDGDAHRHRHALRRRRTLPRDAELASALTRARAVQSSTLRGRLAQSARAHPSHG